MIRNQQFLSPVGPGTVEVSNGSRLLAVGVNITAVRVILVSLLFSL
jgi:hypothetical protein